VNDDIDICDIQAPAPARAKVTTAQLAREERAVMQVLRETLPSLAHLAFSEPSLSLLSDNAKLDTWRLSLLLRKQLSILGPRVGASIDAEAQAVWGDVKAVQSRLRSVIRVVRIAEDAGQPLVGERDPLVRRLVTCERKAWLLRAESHQFPLLLPDLRTIEDDRDLVLTGVVHAMTVNTVMLGRVAAQHSNPAVAVRAGDRSITLARPAESAMKRIGEYFPKPPQCGDIVSVTVRLHRGRLSGEVCGATLSSRNVLVQSDADPTSDERRRSDLIAARSP
jgi:hypothetical protein